MAVVMYVWHFLSAMNTRHCYACLKDILQIVGM